MKPVNLSYQITTVITTKFEKLTIDGAEVAKFGTKYLLGVQFRTKAPAGWKL